MTSASNSIHNATYTPALDVTRNATTEYNIVVNETYDPALEATLNAIYTVTWEFLNELE